MSVKYFACPSSWTASKSVASDRRMTVPDWGWNPPRRPLSSNNSSSTRSFKFGSNVFSWATSCSRHSAFRIAPPLRPLASFEVSAIPSIQPARFEPTALATCLAGTSSTCLKAIVTAFEPPFNKPFPPGRIPAKIPPAASKRLVGSPAMWS